MTESGLELAESGWELHFIHEVVLEGGAGGRSGKPSPGGLRGKWRFFFHVGHVEAPRAAKSGLRAAKSDPRAAKSGLRADKSSLRAA